jgi:hypothetical protein
MVGPGDRKPLRMPFLLLPRRMGMDGRGDKRSGAIPSDPARLVRMSGALRYAVLAPLFACATWTQTGSVYRGRCVHVGVRPSVSDGSSYALTVQVSTDAPVCGEVYPRR